MTVAASEVELLVVADLATCIVFADLEFDKIEDEKFQQRSSSNLSCCCFAYRRRHRCRLRSRRPRSYF